MTTGSRIDYPLEEVAATAAGLVEDGATVYQKWTCVGCGERKMMTEPNLFFARGECDECGTVTDLRVTGCNYTVVMGL